MLFFCNLVLKKNMLYIYVIVDWVNNRKINSL